MQRDEPINAVIVAGTNELGDGFFIPNALVSSPLADEGIDEFIITANIEFFEGYGLGGDDIWRFESDIDSIFASGDDDDDVLDATTDVPGTKIAFTGGRGTDEMTVIARDAELINVHGGAGNDVIRIEALAADVVVAAGGFGRKARAPGDLPQKSQGALIFNTPFCCPLHQDIQGYLILFLLHMRPEP